MILETQSSKKPVCFFNYQLRWSCRKTPCVCTRKGIAENWDSKFEKCTLFFNAVFVQKVLFIFVDNEEPFCLFIFILKNSILLIFLVFLNFYKNAHILKFNNFIFYF